MGGLFSIFHIKSASKAQKACDFAHFTSQWGSSSPPAPPLATLLVAAQASGFDISRYLRDKSFDINWGTTPPETPPNGPTKNQFFE